MIDTIDTHLIAWIRAVLGDVDVVLGAPSDDLDGSVVSLYLLDLLDAPPPRGDRRTPLRIMLRYMISLWSNDAQQAHVLLGRLVFEALGNSDYEVELASLDPSLWLAMGATPRPCFMLRVPAVVERPEPVVPYVRHPMRVRRATFRRMDGLVLDLDDVPLAGARIEVPALRLSARTDFHGRFHFASLPAETIVYDLEVRAGAARANVSVKSADLSDAHPLVIRVDRVEHKET